MKHTHTTCAVCIRYGITIKQFILYLRPHRFEITPIAVSNRLNTRDSWEQKGKKSKNKELPIVRQKQYGGLRAQDTPNGKHNMGDLTPMDGLLETPRGQARAAEGEETTFDKRAEGKED